MVHVCQSAHSARFQRAISTRSILTYVQIAVLAQTLVLSAQSSRRNQKKGMTNMVIPFFLYAQHGHVLMGESEYMWAGVGGWGDGGSVEGEL